MAKIIVGLEADSSIIGKAYYIEGGMYYNDVLDICRRCLRAPGDAWQFEDAFRETQRQWLSEEGCRRMNVNLEAVKNVGLEATPYTPSLIFTGRLDQELR